MLIVLVPPHAKRNTAYRRFIPRPPTGKKDFAVSGWYRYNSPSVDERRDDGGATIVGVKNHRDEYLEELFAVRDFSFDPDWRDDIVDLNVIDIPLVFPEDTSDTYGSGIWVQSRSVLIESAFDQEIRHESRRCMKYLLKKSDLINYHEMKDDAGNICPKDSPVYDLVFTPQAWVTDSLQERCMIYASAQQARGKVLVGGLGFAIYPQLCLHLKRPVQSLTIIEKEPAVIDLVMGSWGPRLDREKRSRIHVIEGTIESFLQESSDQFDTIYLDTWENMDPRFLPAINDVVNRAYPRCASHGKIQCWGYARMVDTFVGYAEMFVNKKINLARFNMDPALEKFAQWLAHKDSVSASQETIKKVAREIAITTAKPLEEYDLHRCLTPFARSFVEMQLNIIRTQKV